MERIKLIMNDLCWWIYFLYMGSYNLIFFLQHDLYINKIHNLAFVLNKLSI
jgi:hypothetical protein